MRVKTGSPIIILPSVTSTNAYAGELIGQGKASNGLVIRAIQQSAGKGQENNKWESEAGENLTLSIVVKPSGLAPARQFMLNKIASLAVYDFVASRPVSEQVSIKWPNDVYIGNRKTAGILINNTITGDTITWSVVGIGLNINQTDFSSDAPNPVSLKQASGINYDLESSLKELCSCFDKWITHLLDMNYDLIDRNYMKVLYRCNEEAAFIYKGQPIQARISGVGEFGHLMLKLQNGSELSCDLKEISMVI